MQDELSQLGAGVRDHIADSVAVGRVHHDNRDCGARAPATDDQGSGAGPATVRGDPTTDMPHDIAGRSCVGRLAEIAKTEVHSEGRDVGPAG